jgi:hypothetical protein
LNVPVVPVIREPAEQLVIVTPSKTSPTGLDTEKPVPDTFTVAPTGPFGTLGPIQGFVTAKVPVAV